MNYYTFLSTPNKSVGCGVFNLGHFDLFYGVGFRWVLRKKSCCGTKNQVLMTHPVSHAASASDERKHMSPKVVLMAS